MNRSNNQNPIGSSERLAFTLIEMLVSITLVLLIMSMFAAIFDLATGTVKVQRGIANNDQRARSLTTIIRSDFSKRTMRYVFPYYPTEDPATSATSFGNRAGYFYISTNDVDSYQDDLIQFTVDASLLQESSLDTPYFGRSALLYDQIEGKPIDLHNHVNQPDADDGDLNPNGTSSSDIAEIAIFMRNGKLYRRVSLLRQPLSAYPVDLEPQPESSWGNRLLIDQNSDAALSGQIGGRFFFPPSPGSLSDHGIPSDDFWRHFDFSALPVGNSPNAPTNAEFVGVDSLNNELSNLGTLQNSAIGLGNPHTRFGFNPTTGLSREHDNLGTRRFIGRFLHGETSHSLFNWPIAKSAFGSGNPMDIENSPLTLTPGQDLVNELMLDPGPPSSTRGGPRVMEDLLQANVHEFRVEIWDERVGRFVTPGYGAPTDPKEAAGDFHYVRNLQLNERSPYVFDTWHKDVTVPGTDDRLAPPYISYRWYPPRQNDDPPGSSSFLSPQHCNPAQFWKANTPYKHFDNVRNPCPDEDVVFVTPNTPVFSWGNMPSPGFQIAYKCIKGGRSGSSEPSWPKTPGYQVKDGTVLWEAFDNRRPLKAVRLTTRFYDPESDQIRQLTLILSLTDES